MPKSSQHIYNTGAICGQHQCPCGYTFTGYDQRTRDKAKKLHKLKCAIGASTSTTVEVNIPDTLLIDAHHVEQVKKQFYDDK